MTICSFSVMRRIRLRWKSTVGMLSFICCLLYFLLTPLQILLVWRINVDDYVPFEPEVLTDFDTSGERTIKIPRIIHQTWKNTLVPPRFADKVKTFADKNPNWEYYLWTDESARMLIEDHYPDLLDVWDGIMYSKDKIRRADAIRYVALYHYGGVYADMDVVNLRSLDFAITKHPCVFTAEPFEQSVFRGFVPFLISNAIMLCTPKHPFLKQLVENLHMVEHFQDVGSATGPGYVTTQYKLYNSLPKEKEHFVSYNNRSLTDTSDNSPYFNKGKLPMTHKSSVYIANTHYFMFSIDTNAYGYMYRKCLFFAYLTHLQQRACANIARKGLIRTPNKYSIMDHKWYRTYSWYNFYNYITAYNAIASTDIKQIVPHYKIYSKS